MWHEAAERNEGRKVSLRERKKEREKSTVSVPEPYISSCFLSKLRQSLNHEASLAAVCPPADAGLVAGPGKLAEGLFRLWKILE